MRGAQLYRLLTAGPRLKLLSADLSNAQQLAAVLRRAQPAVDVVVQLQPANPEGEAAGSRCCAQSYKACSAICLHSMVVAVLNQLCLLLACWCRAVSGRPAGLAVQLHQ